MKRGIYWLMCGLLVLSTTACGVSEAEYQEVTAERDALKRGLEESQEENEVLNEAILEIYKERETLLAQIEELKVERVNTRPRPAPVISAPPKPVESKPVKPVNVAAKGYYIVKKGDTINKIAYKTGVPKATLISLNNIENEAYIWEGQKLILPDGTSNSKRKPRPAERKPKPSTDSAQRVPTSGRILFYYVKPGESLQDISKRTGVNMATLKRLNGIDENTVLTIGQRLRLQ